MSGVSTQQISESVNNVVENVVDSSKAVINNAMSNIDPFLSTNDPITTVISFSKKRKLINDLENSV